MTDDRTRATDRGREGDWDRTQWEGEGQGEGRHELEHDPADATTGDRWTKQQWVGDRGEGAPAPQDPDEMQEGENRLSGDRHTSGEQHWGQGQSSERR
jgi:hypothetical protein